MPEPGRWRGRITPRQNAILIGVIVVCVPLFTVAQFVIDDATGRLAVIAAYIVLIAVVAGVFRLRFERMNRNEHSGGSADSPRR